jgi:hypothetical protein
VKSNAVAIIVLAIGGLSSVHGATLYSTLPAITPTAPIYSWSYGAQQTTEFGNLIEITPGNLNSATVLLSNWAYESLYYPLETLGTTTGYNVALHLNLYNVGDTTTPFASSDVTAFVQWRPEPVGSDTCPTGLDDPAPSTGSPYLTDGGCYSGASQLVNFGFNDIDLTGLANNQLIYGLAFDATGPASSLNFGITTDGPSTGTNPDLNSAYLNAATGFYLDGGDGIGTFRQDSGYGTDVAQCGSNEDGPLYCYTNGYSAEIQLSTDSLAPEPGTVSIMLIGLMGLGWGYRKNRAGGTAGENHKGDA